MNLSEYQARAKKFALYTDHENPSTIAIYPFLGLCEEAGEVAGKLAKLYRGDYELDKDLLVKELGDVLWMVAACCNELGVNMNAVAETNLAKLYNREAAGVIRGEGDSR